ncbi:MAG: beta strand repeat-containing protein [Chloroflexota bacterium]
MKTIRKILRSLTPPLVLIALTMSLIGGAVTVTPARAASFTVTKTADTNDGACNGDCSLREAIAAANASPGADTITLPAGTYQLTIANGGGVNEDNNATGDLDILDSVTIQGAGSGITIIQAGTNNSNGIDKVIGANPLCTAGVSVTIDSVTVRYGYNSQPSGSPDFSHTGGGIDYCAGGNGSIFTLTNSVVSDNTNVNGYGGGLNMDAYLAPSYTANITNVTFSNNRTLSLTETATGGAINIFGDQVIVNIAGSTFTGNLTTNPNSAGGAIFFRPSALTVGPVSSLLVNGSTFTSNTAAGRGGAIATATFGAGTTVTIQNSTFTSNTATASFGGAIDLDSTNLNSTPFSLSHLVITGNTAGTSGGGVYVGNSNVTMSKSRIVNNSAPTGSGIHKSVDAATATVTNNWWGCSTGPGAAPCDVATTSGGTLTFTPWYRGQLTAGTSPIVTNQSTSLTASFLTNSSGGAVPLADISEIIGRTVAWAATNGNLSGTQSTVQTAGTATGSFQATSAGTAIISAKVDNDNTAPVSSNVLSLTVNKANTTAAITNGATLSSVDSVTGQPVTVTYSVTGAFGNTPTAPTGNVTVSDGTDSCTASAAAGQCNVTFRTAGAKTIIATYAGDTNFNASPASTSASHTVNKADTTTTITSDAPDPSVTGETVTFNVTVAAVAPGAAVAPTTITGSVTVSDGGTNSCIVTLTAGAGSCTIDFPAATSYSMTGTYGGDVNFNGSASTANSHTVNKADTTTTITSDAPDSSTPGQSVTVNYTVSVTSPGSGTPTGNVTVSDGVDSCIGTVAAGTCSLSLTTVGNRTLTATYAGDANFNGSTSADEPHTVGKHATTTTITSDLPDPSLVGEAVTIQYSVSGGSSPSGNVTVSDGTLSCIGTVAAGQCDITFTSAGAKTLTATYAGDATHSGSVSANESHQVGSADVTVTITSDTPDPSSPSQSVTVDFTVTVNPPGVGTPTGNVTVSDGVDSCVGTVAAGTCNLTLTTSGARTLTATYAGDANFNGAASAGESHTVDGTSPDVTINQAAGQSDPTGGATINFKVVFNEPVTDFDDAADVTLSGSAGATTVVITGGPSTYNVAVSGMTLAGTVIADIPAGVAADGVGNLNNASTSTDNTVTFTLDGTPPDTSIDSQPANPTSSSTAAFTFSGTDNITVPASLTFECQLDGGGFSACSSPKNYTGLSLGSHTFDVRASDEAGNTDPTPASFIWEIVSGPSVTVLNGVCSRPTATTGKLNLKLVDPEGDPLTFTFLSSSNTALVPAANVRINGLGAVRTVVIRGVAGVSGTSVVRFKLSDGVTVTQVVITFKVGTNGNNTITGTAGIDMLFGMNGNDVLNGGANGDLLCGGNGNDTLNGGAGNDTLNGELGDDILNGGSGNDALSGMSGADTLTGSTGADYFSGGLGLDVLTDYTPSEGDTKDKTSP